MQPIGTLLESTLTLYHGTTKAFHTFDLLMAGKRDTGNLGRGVYLARTPRLAMLYAEANSEKWGGTPVVLRVHATLNKIAEMDASMRARLTHEADVHFPPSAHDHARSERMREWFLTNDYDAVEVGGDEIVVFDPKKLHIDGVEKVETEEERRQMILAKFRAKKHEATTGMLLVPEVAQTSSFSCGAATLMALLKYWGVAKDGETEAQLRGPLETDVQDGTDASSMERLARARGLDAHVDVGLNLDMLRSLCGEGWTVIVEMQAWAGEDVRDSDRGSGHFVVVLGVDGSRVTVMDPALRPGDGGGNYGWMPSEEFERAWLDDIGTRGVGIVVRSKAGAPGLRGPLPGEPVRVETGREQVNESPIDFKGVNLHTKYAEFNRKYFDDALPKDIKLAFKETKGATGTTNAKVVIAGGASRGILAKMTPQDVKVNDLSITMNTLIQYDEVEFDAYLLHEMIHVFFIATGWPFEVHGHKFIEKAHEVGQKAGFKIPLTHEVKATDAVAGKEREVGVFVVEKGNGQPHDLFLLFDPKALGEFQKKAESYVSMFKRPIKLYLAKTRAWALAPVKRKPEKYGISLSKLEGPIAANLDLSPAKATLEVIVQPKTDEGHGHIKCIHCGRSVAEAGWHHGAPGASVCRDCHKGESVVESDCDFQYADGSGCDKEVPKVKLNPELCQKHQRYCIKYGKNNSQCHSHESANRQVPVGVLIETAGLPEIGSDATRDAVMKAGAHVVELARGKKVSPDDAVAWAADLMRQFGFDVRRQRSTPRDIDPRIDIFPSNVYNVLLGIKSKADAAAKRAAKKAQPAPSGHWADGRKVPVEGDEVYMMSAGLFGMGAQIQGKVVMSRGALRIDVTGSSSALGSGLPVGGIRGKTVPLDAQWTVVGDPSVAAKHAAAAAATRSKEQARKAEEEKDLADNIALAVRHGHKVVTSWSQVKVGDVVVSHSRYGPEKPEDWSENAVKVTKLHGPHGVEGMRSELSAETTLGSPDGYTLDPTGKLYKPPQESVSEALPNRPSNPHDISFDRRCFKQVGTKTKWVVTMTAPRYPEVFNDEHRAKAFAKKMGREAVPEVEPVMQRVSWTCPKDEAEAPPTKPAVPPPSSIGQKRAIKLGKLGAKTDAQKDQENQRHQTTLSTIRQKETDARQQTYQTSESAKPLGVLIESPKHIDKSTIR